MKRPVVLGITIGDVGGIGPEIALKAIDSSRLPRRLRPILIGSASIIAGEADRLGIPCPTRWEPGKELPSATACLWDPGSPKIRNRCGKASVSAARAASSWIRAGVEASLAGDLAGIITAPICKEGFHRAGIPFAGHTEMLADLTGIDNFAMMLIGGPLRVVLATRHIPLRDVVRELDTRSIIVAGKLTSDALTWLGCNQSAIAVCGVNPHAGDGGAIGQEERDVIIPAIRSLRRSGIDVEGPVAGDTACYAAASGRYGAVLAMYHDQGLAPLKTLAFDKGVNLTLGLPFVRTSPDHGTAFDIAGKGVANPSSMIEAMKLAYKLADRSNPWK